LTQWETWDEEAVMNGDLPVIPDGNPPPGLWVPLARWWKPTDVHGYLLTVLLNPEPGEGTTFKHDIDMFERGDADRWRWVSGGGSDWRFGFDRRPAGDELFFEGAGSGGGTGSPLFVAPGVAGSGVSTVLVRGATWSAESRVEPRTGAFLLGADLDEEIEITALGAGGRPLRSLPATTVRQAVQEG
jgi:hypothetical protein